MASFAYIKMRSKERTQEWEKNKQDLQYYKEIMSLPSKYIL